MANDVLDRATRVTKHAHSSFQLHVNYDNETALHHITRDNDLLPAIACLSTLSSQEACVRLNDRLLSQIIR
ncbi:hypothetical protein J6590_012972 [Homalodisca vitripennis]|nr:hypothetical protein J6590_012972 [Homalodisca vitripennis]